MISCAQCKEKSTNAVHQHNFPYSYHKYSLHVHKEMKEENIIQEHSVLNWERWAFKQELQSSYKSLSLYT